MDCKLIHSHPTRIHIIYGLKKLFFNPTEFESGMSQIGSWPRRFDMIEKVENEIQERLAGVTCACTATPNLHNNTGFFSFIHVLL